jgi:acyl-coenzyme A thioesterase PaaI-like protein
MIDIPENPLLEALNQSVPFARHAGICVTAANEAGAIADLPEAPFLLNHVGSQHAGALFTVGEAASGAAMTASFVDLLGTALPLVRQANIKYRKVARGSIKASAEIAREVDSVRDEYVSTGKADFEIHVALHDAEGNEVATMVVEWSLRRRGS